jgi:hypothetical protein
MKKMLFLYDPEWRESRKTNIETGFFSLFNLKIRHCLHMINNNNNNNNNLLN